MVVSRIGQCAFCRSGRRSRRGRRRCSSASRAAQRERPGGTGATSAWTGCLHACGHSLDKDGFGCRNSTRELARCMQARGGRELKGEDPRGEPGDCSLVPHRTRWLQLDSDAALFSCLAYSAAGTRSSTSRPRGSCPASSSSDRWCLPPRSGGLPPRFRAHDGGLEKPGKKMSNGV